MKYTYRDFVTGRPRWTRGKFIEWYKDGWGIWRAVFARKSDVLLMPEYCMTKETKAVIPPHEEDGDVRC